MHADEVYFPYLNNSFEVPQIENEGLPPSYCSGDNTSEHCVQMAEVFCTEQENYCTIENCRCSDSAWVRHELETTTGQLCFACAPPPKPRCTYLRDYCTAGPCECMFGHTKIQVFERDGVSPCFQCQAALPSTSRNGEVPMLKATMLFVFVVLVGLAVGCFVGWLWEPAAGTATRGRKGGKQRPRSWSERWALYLAGIFEVVSRALVEKSVSLHRGTRPLQRQFGHALKKVLLWTGCTFGALSGAVARIHKPDAQAETSPVKATGHAKPADKPKVVHAEPECPKRETPIRPQRAQVTGSAAEPTLVQTRLLKKLQKRKELRLSPTQQESTPSANLPSDESWIDELEAEAVKVANAAPKKSKKDNRKKLKSRSKDDLGADMGGNQDAIDMTDQVSCVPDTEQAEVESTAPMDATGALTASPRAHTFDGGTIASADFTYSRPTKPLDSGRSTEALETLQDEQVTSSDCAVGESSSQEESMGTPGCPQGLKGRLSAEIANGRLAMITLVGVLTSSTLGGAPRTRQTVLPLRALESVLGVQDHRVSLWDPAGFVTDGIAQQVFSGDFDGTDLVLDASGAPETRHQVPNNAPPTAHRKKQARVASPVAHRKDAAPPVAHRKKQARSARVLPPAPTAPPPEPPRDPGTKTACDAEDGIVFGSLTVESPLVTAGCNAVQAIDATYGSYGEDGPTVYYESGSDDEVMAPSRNYFRAQTAPIALADPIQAPELTPERSSWKEIGTFKGFPPDDYEAESPQMSPFYGMVKQKLNVLEGEERVYMFRTFIHIEEPNANPRACRRSRSA